MSKSVLISIRPEWCEKIASGEKIFEIRKNRPKIETPFKCFIYQTKHKWICSLLRSLGKNVLAEMIECSTGQVIGEFVCDSINEFVLLKPAKGSDYSATKIASEGGYFTNIKLAKSCVTLAYLIHYMGWHKSAYCWHISDLVIYDKPRELREFYKPGFSSIEDLDEDLCKYCYETDYGEKKCYSTPYGPVMCEGDYCTSAYEAYLDEEGFTITRAPQSWCYVEDI